ncbi:YybH family protein [Salinispira pacifica]|uniref:DUF4440 domain-containing protein n=1 Tax=Salinispira pacifica TaxID=1307761 RepID=V5WNS4_9SPIO|nr:nuclear transport factor 2 family protein [Salinispira pacifica]AHC16736.1 hypothetical protein L21SP2_3398 [Salinispira pacifica]
MNQYEIEVTKTEEAFAKSMASRNFSDFCSYLDEDCIFLNGSNVLRGRIAVEDAWQAYFTADAAPFSWKPETVIAQEGGETAMSTGPVFDPHGTRIAGYTSIWKNYGNGIWRIIFDKGETWYPESG